jgi:cobalt-zinc-cadmium efflux system membrane fusion protein
VITQTWFSLGDYVRQGQELAEIKSTELTSLASERKTLESRHTVALRNVDALQSMYDDGIASEKDLLAAKSEEQIIRAELEKIHANLSFFSPGKQPGTFLIKAPASGYVVEKNINAGTPVTAGNEPLFTISDLSNVWVAANVYTGDLSYVKERMPVVLRSAAYKDQTFTGTIQALSQVFDAEEKVLKARIVMENPGLHLKPGMFMDVLVKKETGERALRVPEKALIFKNNKNYVLVHHSDCNLEVREVGIAAKSNGDVYISHGLQAGEQVITRNHLLILEALHGRGK